MTDFGPVLAIGGVVVIALGVLYELHVKGKLPFWPAKQASILDRPPPASTAPASTAPALVEQVPVVQAPAASIPVVQAPAPVEQAPVVVTIPPVTPDSVFIDRDDFMIAIGRDGVTQAVRLDGTTRHGGFGPGMDFYTQPAGGISGKPASAPVVQGGAVQGAPVVVVSSSPPAVSSQPLTVNSAESAMLVRLALGRSVHIVQGGSIRLLFNSGAVGGMLTVVEYSGGGYGPAPLPMWASVQNAATGVEVGKTDGMTITWSWAVGQNGVEANTDYVAVVKRDDSCIAVDLNER